MQTAYNGYPAAQVAACARKCDAMRRAFDARMDMATYYAMYGKTTRPRDPICFSASGGFSYCSFIFYFSIFLTRLLCVVFYFYVLFSRFPCKQTFRECVRKYREQADVHHHWVSRRQVGKIK